MELNKALYISQEIQPYLNSSTMADMCRYIPQGMQERGIEVRTFMPKYGCINERRNQLHEVIRLSGLNIIIDDTDHPLIIKVATLQPTRMQVYFIDNEDFFEPHATSAQDTLSRMEDNDERIIFFALGVVETVRKLRWYPGIIHCSGWITALNPLYIKVKYPDDPAFKNAKIVYSLFGDTFEGNLDPRMVEKLEMDGITKEQIKAITQGEIDAYAINCLAMDHADAIIQATEDVDPRLIEYAKYTGKPFLPFPGEDNVEAYHEFYTSL